jgi:hypothetical protein
MAVENKIISRHWHDPHSISSATRSKSTKQTGANNKSKAVDRKRNQSGLSSRTELELRPAPVDSATY